MEWRGTEGSGALTLGKELGKGGEGSVYAVEAAEGLNHAELVAKIYHDPAGRAQKLVEMLRRPVYNDYIAWPENLIIDNGVFKGYLMRRLDYDSYRPWAEVAHASTRRSNASDFDYQYALYSALNLSYLLDSVHQAGHFIGDLNESNVLVGKDATVSLVDTDSAQVGEHLCLVGKPEFTAPEIVGSFADNPRTKATDIYAYGIMVWQLLTGGTHPTDGEWIGQGEPTSVTERIRSGSYPAIESTQNYKALSRVPTDAISPRIRSGVKRLISLDPAQRGTTEDFRNILQEELRELVQCSVVKSHWYSGSTCPWCIRVNAGLNDPWGGVTPQAVNAQMALPSISFETPEEKAAARVSLQPQGNSGANFRAGMAPLPGIPSNNSSMPYSQPVNTPGTVNIPGSGQGYSQQPPQPEPEIPTKVKGKSVLVYADGTWEVRPPLTELARTNFKLALSCFFDELPLWIRFWWGKHSIPAKLWALALGLVVGVATSASWWALTLIDNDFLPGFLHKFNLFYWLGLSSVASSGLFVLIFFFSGLIFTLKHKQYVSEVPWKTILRFLVIGLFYGPLFILIAIFFLAYLLVLLVIAIFHAER